MKYREITLLLLLFSLFLNLSAQTPPTVYVAGDSTGDYNCDGVSDQVEINQALDFVAANSDYTTVYLKGANKFIIDEPVIVPSNTILTGDSTAVIYLKDSVGWWTHYKPVIGQKDAASWDAWGNPGDTIFNVEIYGFEINGGRQLEPDGDNYMPLIHFYNPSNVKIHNLILSNSRWDIVRLSASQYKTNINSKVYDNLILNSGHEGVCFIAVTNFEAFDNRIYHTRTNCGIRAKDTDTLKIYNNTIGNSMAKNSSGYVGILLENEHTPIAQAEIYRNFIYGKNGGIHLSGEGGVYPLDSRINVHIHHNRIFKSNKRVTSGNNFEMEGGIEIDGYHKTIIEYNVIESGVTDGISYQGTSGGDSEYKTIVRNNIIINNEGYGINNKEPSINTFESNNNIIYNNNAGNYKDVTSSTDIYSDPLFASTHSALNQWHHIVVTYDNATETFKIYIDGVEHAKQTYPGFGTIGTNTKYLFLGTYRAIAYWFQGTMDELAIWNRALTQTEVDSLYNNGQSNEVTGNLTSGLQAYFKMENNWNDISGNGYNALDSTASFTTDALRDDYAGIFDGTDDGVEYPNYLSTTMGLSISVWAKIQTNTDEEQTILNKGSQGSNSHIWLHFKKESVMFELGNGTERHTLEANILNPQDLDFHVKSKTGRWFDNTWVKDDVMSPCIDNGYPTSDYSNELLPNGDTVNIGVYGNTIQASRSKTHNYYVSTTGDDTKSGLSIADAWKTIAFAASSSSPVTAGDTVFILQGNYNERVIVEKSGVEGYDIVFINYQNDDVIVDGNGISWGASWNGLVDIGTQSYLEFDGINVKNADYAGFWIEDSNNVLVKNCKTYNTYSSGIGVWTSSHITIEDNEVELACNDGEQECITISGSDTCEIFKNLVHDNGAGTNGGEGIDVKQGSHHIKVYQNEVHHLNERIGIYIDAWDKHTYKIDVYNNKIHHCGNNGFNAQTEMGGLLDSINIYNNISYFNKWDGIALGSVTADPNVTVTPVKHIKVINNTCYKNGSYQGGWGYGILVNNDDLEDVTIRNNICSRNSAQIAIENIDTIQVIDHNLIYGYNGAADCVYGSDSVVGDPVFVDTIAFDFHLQAASPAIDKGIFVDSIDFDMDSIPRPLLLNPDIGAYEYGIYWTGAISNDWHTAGNWSNNQVPAPVDSVTIPPPDFYKYHPEVNSNAQIKKIYFNGDGKIIIKNNVNFEVLE